MVTKKKRKEKKKTFAFFKAQKLKPKRNKVIPMKANVCPFKMGELIGIV
jgi:hypothetical protein